jgi:hypothetical protein
MTRKLTILDVLDNFCYAGNFFKKSTQISDRVWTECSDLPNMLTVERVVTGYSLTSVISDHARMYYNSLHNVMANLLLRTKENKLTKTKKPDLCFLLFF